MAQDFDQQIQIFESGQTTHPVIRCSADTGIVETGSSQIDGWVRVNASGDGHSTIVLDGGSGSANFGDPGKLPTVEILGKTGRIKLGKEGQEGSIVALDQGANETAHLSGQNGSLTLGGIGQGGSLVLLDNNRATSVRMDAVGASLTLGAAGHSSSFVMKDRSGKYSVELSGNGAQFSLGGNTNNGTVYLVDRNNETTVSLKADTGSLELGGKAVAGDLTILNAKQIPVVHANASNATLTLGRFGGPGGTLNITNPDGGYTLFASAGSIKGTFRSAIGGFTVNTRSACALGLGNGRDPSIFQLKNDKGQTHFQSFGRRSSSQEIGRSNNHASDGSYAGITNIWGMLCVYGHFASPKGSNDIAEEFPSAENIDVLPGSVMKIGEEGKLILSNEAYDRRVAGVVSGAGDLEPAIVLGAVQATLDLQVEQQVDQDEQDPMSNDDGEPAQQEHTVPLSLSGKVYCMVDSSNGPIEAGDMLTTSDTPGHAMKADDPLRAFGAVIGKALEAHDGDAGLIPIIVSLQ